MFKTTEWKLPVRLKAMISHGYWDSKEAVNLYSYMYILEVGTAVLHIDFPSYTLRNRNHNLALYLLNFHCTYSSLKAVVTDSPCTGPCQKAELFMNLHRSRGQTGIPKGIQGVSEFMILSRIY